ncbi:ATP-dependent zinc protease [Pseudoalteromonas fenneropenaei]|uniref:ATP-dependent zinc protease n=1 Tax=Pseudoalteromonas fenneropenaei TaxID=1737459 RepID=A0ABV7CLM2_9GAMM
MAKQIQVGWREWVALPDLGIARIKAKVDTGARTSCLHAYQLKTFERDGEPWVEFWLHPVQNNSDITHRCEAKIIDKRNVTDSGGHKESRFVIASQLHIAGKSWPIEITLTNRDSMKFRMLLGRTAMAGRISVDPAASFLTGQ